MPKRGGGRDEKVKSALGRCCRMVEMRALFGLLDCWRLVKGSLECTEYMNSPDMILGCAVKLTL